MRVGLLAHSLSVSGTQPPASSLVANGVLSRRREAGLTASPHRPFPSDVYLALRRPLVISKLRAGIAHHRRLKVPAGSMMISQGVNSSKTTSPDSSKSTSKEKPCKTAVPSSLTDPESISHSSVMASTSQALLNSPPKTK